MLNQEEFIQKWKEIKGGIRTLWGRISDEELEEMKGDINEVSGLVEDRYGETKDEIRKKLKQLMDSFDNDSDRNFSINVSSYERSPVQDRTASQSQIEDTAEDYFTRGPERSAFDDSTYDASLEGESNHSGANPNRERFPKNTSPGAFKPGTFDQTVKDQRH